MGAGLGGNAYVIVGGTAGIGLASAHALAAQGADVVLVGRDPGRARDAAETVGRTYGVRAVPVVGDASSPQPDVDALVASAVDAVGPIAGVAVMTGTDRAHTRKPLDAMSDEDWAAAFEDLFMGTVRPCRAVVPYLLERGSGAIVTTAAQSVHAPDLTGIPYSTCKAAVALYTKGLARAYGARGIQANCICPGAVETETLHAARARYAEQRGLPYEEALERVLLDDYGLDISMHRLADPAEVGELVAFLLSGRAAYLTGALINIDGGTNF
jgi:NAD(P)-dependent dehydrogenase (short-subunit alcohol dehydrogenase family)